MERKFKKVWEGGFHQTWCNGDIHILVVFKTPLIGENPQFERIELEGRCWCSESFKAFKAKKTRDSMQKFSEEVKRFEEVANEYGKAIKELQKEVKRTFGDVNS